MILYGFGIGFGCDVKITKARLQTIEDPEMYLFIEKEIRKGIINAIKRYSEANNICNPDEKSMYPLYSNANNLYAWAMVQKLLYYLK